MTKTVKKAKKKAPPFVKRAMFVCNAPAKAKGVATSVTNEVASVAEMVIGTAASAAGRDR